MRIYFILIFLSQLVLSQKMDNEDFLLLQSENNSYYYVLTKNGYYISKKNDGNLFYKYKTELPKSLNIPLNSLTPLFHNSKNYLLYPGGGLLYEFSDGSISRIDRSFPHRNQYGAYFFSYKENIYLIGGYGYWETKSIITKFNFNNGDWEIVNTSGQRPDGLDQGTYFLSDGKLYVFDFLTREISTQKEKRNENLYVLNLESFNWKKLGVINEIIKPTNENNNIKRFFKSKDKLVFSYSNNPEFFVVDIKNNSIKKFKDGILFYKISGQSIIKDNVLIGAVKNSLTNKFSIEVFDLGDLNAFSSEEAYYLYRDKDLFFQYIYFSLFFLSFLIILLSVYYNKISQTYVIDEASISISGNTLDLSDIELEILNLFSKNRVVSNSKLMNLFSKDDKTKDYAVKRKNKALIILGDKLFDSFKINFIGKNKSENDSRQLSYSLNKKIRILKETSL